MAAGMSWAGWIRAAVLPVPAEQLPPLRPRALLNPQGCSKGEAVDTEDEDQKNRRDNESNP